jgi:precorrin-4 methylase
MTPRAKPYQPTRLELDEIAHDYCRAAQDQARRDRYETCEAYLELYGAARDAMDRLDAKELDLDIPISVEDLDTALFNSSRPSTLRSNM